MGKVFLGGVPYAVDVQKLQEAFPAPTLAEGRVIPHAELAEAIRTDQGTQRYYAVINSWMAQMKNTNGIFIIWEPTVGIRVLGPADILRFAEHRTRQKIRQTNRAIGHFAWVPRARLDTIGQQRLDHQTRVVSAIRDALKTAHQELAINLAPIQSLPRPKIVREGGESKERAG